MCQYPVASLCTAPPHHQNVLRSCHGEHLRVFYIFKNKQTSSPFTTLTDNFLKVRRSVFTARYGLCLYKRTSGYFVLRSSGGSECGREYVRLTGTCDVTVTPFVVDGLGTMTQNWFLITYEFSLVVECVWQGRTEACPNATLFTTTTTRNALRMNRSFGSDKPPITGLSRSVRSHDQSRKCWPPFDNPICLCTSYNTGGTLLQQPATVKQSSNGFPE